MLKADLHLSSKVASPPDSRISAKKKKKIVKCYHWPVICNMFKRRIPDILCPMQRSVGYSFLYYCKIKIFKFWGNVFLLFFAWICDGIVFQMLQVAKLWSILLFSEDLLTAIISSSLLESPVKKGHTFSVKQQHF